MGKFPVAYIGYIKQNWQIQVMNSFMTEVHIIEKPVHWFAEQINRLVSMWQGPPSWKSYWKLLTRDYEKYYLSESNWWHTLEADMFWRKLSSYFSYYEFSAVKRFLLSKNLMKNVIVDHFCCEILLHLPSLIKVSTLNVFNRKYVRNINH